MRAVCGTAPAAHVDHGTGAVRALLRADCNGGLGRFRDDPYLLHVAALHVGSHRERQALEQPRGAAGVTGGTASRPESPPVGSQRHPGSPRGTSTRGTGRRSERRRRETAGEADG